MRLPPVLTPDDLPAPELQAARLDGIVFAVDGCFAPVDEIEQPRHRAAAAHAGLPDRLIAEQLSAAWVWGAIGTPPTRHQFCVGADSRVSHDPARWVTVREVVIETSEIVDLDGWLVTSPQRTVLDLVRFGAGDREVIRRLLDDAQIESAIRLLEGRRNLPNKRQAISALKLAL